MHGDMDHMDASTFKAPENDSLVKKDKMPEEHSEEIDRGIWRMHRRGDDIKRIMANLKFCELIVSRKYINMAIKRVTLQMKDPTFLNISLHEEVQGEEVDEDLDDVTDPVEADTVQNMAKIDDKAGEEETQTEVMDEASAEEITQGAEDEVKKPRRIKTTDDLIEKLQEDFRLYPNTKVKVRAAKFGIAVGTLCQIKHNILKMPKETGRTWKSTPQMVEAIACHMLEFPEMKVKDRAKRFGISVGTLCRIMHDILQLPKRSVTRTVPRSGENLTSTHVFRTVAPPGSVKIVVKENRETTDESLKKTRKRKKTEPVKKSLVPVRSLSPKKSVTQTCQLRVNGEGTSQMYVLTFDPETAAQLSNEGSVGLQVAGKDDIIWVVNSPSDLDQSTVEGLIETEALPE